MTAYIRVPVSNASDQFIGGLKLSHYYDIDSCSPLYRRNVQYIEKNESLNHFFS